MDVVVKEGRTVYRAHYGTAAPSVDATSDGPGPAIHGPTCLAFSPIEPESRPGRYSPLRLLLARINGHRMHKGRCREDQFSRAGK